MRINQLLSQDNLERINSTLDDIRVVAMELREHKELIAETEAVLARANEAIGEIHQLARSGNRLVEQDGRRSLNSLGNAAQSLDNMASQLEQPVGEFASTGLPQIMSALASLQRAVDNLDRTLGEVQQSPQGLVARPPAQEIEVKP